MCACGRTNTPLSLSPSMWQQTQTEYWPDPAVTHQSLHSILGQPKALVPQPCPHPPPPAIPFLLCRGPESGVDKSIGLTDQPVWCCMPVNLVLGRLRKEDQEFKVSLSYKRYCLKRTINRCHHPKRTGQQGPRRQWQLSPCLSHHKEMQSVLLDFLPVPSPVVLLLWRPSPKKMGFMPQHQEHDSSPVLCSCLVSLALSLDGYLWALVSPSG